MDEEDIIAKINRLKAETERAAETFADAIAKADADCLSTLQAVCDTFIAIHAKVAEAQLLVPPCVHDRSKPVRTDLAIDDPALWHQYDEDYWHHQSPCLHAGLDGPITYNPIRKEWRYRGLYGEEITPARLVSVYTDRLAEWVVHSYPARKLAAEEEERKAAAADEKEAQRRERRDRDDQFMRRLFGFGCLGFLALCAALILLNDLILS